MTFSRPIKIAGAVAVCAAVVFYFSTRPHSDTTKGTKLGTVHRMDLVQRITVSGEVWPSRRLDIKPPFNGYIAKLYVKVGDHLKPGDPIVTFSPTLNGASENFPIRAGFPGTVTQVLKTEGQYVTTAGDKNLVVRVDDLSHLSILASVPELDIAKVKVGQPARIRVSALIGRSFEGKISEIDLSAKDQETWNAASTEFAMRVSIDSHEERLLPGMSAVLNIITQKRQNVLALPHEYVEEKDGAFFVTAADGQKQKVQIGMETDENVELLSGVHEGELIRMIDFLNPALSDN